LPGKISPTHLSVPLPPPPGSKPNKFYFPRFTSSLHRLRALYFPCQI
jgi:hypothetical protein